MTAAEPRSFERAEVVIRGVADLQISSKTIERVVKYVGPELAARRDADSRCGDALAIRPEAPPELAVVECDGGRIRTREPGHAVGVHGVGDGWRGTKNAVFIRAARSVSAEDPQPEPPDGFRDPEHVAKIVELQALSAAAASPTPAASAAAQTSDGPKADEPAAAEDWRPKRLVRTVLSSMAGSNGFGRQMRREAARRWFAEAKARAFLGDGLPWNWTIWKEHFGAFTPILDFIHPLSYLHEAAKAVHGAGADAWDQYLAWMSGAWRAKLGEPAADAPETDPRKVVATTIGYLDRNRGRMKYPDYRCEGMPVTTAWMESLVKEMNYRDKGTEMFWNDPEGAESILQVRAASLSEDERLNKHLRPCPGCPFTRRPKPPILLTKKKKLTCTLQRHKSKEGRPMPFRKSSSMDSAEIQRVARGWGKVVARRVEERVGPDLDMDADDIETYAKDAACSVARGAIEELLEKKAAALDLQQPCPECQRLCPVEREPRTISFWGGPITYREPIATAWPAAGIFFPQRPSLRLTPHHYSPSVLRKIALATARHPSFQETAAALEDMAEVTISGRQVTRIATEIGHELEAGRDQQTQQFQDRRLTPTTTTRPALAVVEADGGRLRVRGEGDGPGAHAAAWREDKVALLSTAARKHFKTDPQPELPTCFRDRAYVEKLARDVGSVSSLDLDDDDSPELLTRTYVATIRDSEAFGAMVAAEAHRRNFQAADRGAFVGEGAAWLWKLHQRHFPQFTPIVDFLHVFSYVFAAARAATTEPATRWKQYLGVGRGVLARPDDPNDPGDSRLPRAAGAPSAEELESLAEDDPRKVLPRCVTYLKHNASPMDYLRYRREGLPTTSSHAESTVKIFNRRVKGSEKAWGEQGAEAMLQLRAAYLSEDGRLERHQKNRTAPPTELS